MKQYSLLLDIGGTDIKLAKAVNNSLEKSSVTRTPMPSILVGTSGVREIEAQEMITRIDKAISEFIDLHGEPSEMRLTGQVGSWLIIDSKEDLYRNIISWQDYRSRDLSLSVYFDSFGDKFDKSKNILSNSGNEDWPGAPWRTFPSAVTVFNKGSILSFYTLLSWVLWELSGHTSNVTHITDAAATGMVDIKTNTWIEPLESKSVNILFPEITTSYVSLVAHRIWNFPIFVGIGDQQCSLNGIELNSGDYVINAGTGGQVVKLHEDEVVEYPIKIRPYFKNSFIQTITHIPSGRFIESFLFELNRTHNSNYDWEWLWSRGVDWTGEKIPQSETDWTIEDFYKKWISINSDPWDSADQFMSEVADNFLSALEKLDLGRNPRVVLAGGVGQKMQCLHKKIERKLGVHPVVSTSVETTLEGLARLNPEH